LVGMHARARSIGGELTIQSQNGVTIELWAPCRVLQTEGG
jgi:signal transduction histidine kinase